MPKWKIEELRTLYELPLLDLVYRAASLYREHHRSNDIQFCHLISIKTGGCPEDCAYCAQSSRYKTSVKASPLMKVEEVVERARLAVKQGATRICMGAAWREVKDNHAFETILEMIKRVAELNVEVCVTLGLLNEEQAQHLVDAGLTAYNHNLDTSRSYYKTIITTRTYDDRLKTLDIVGKKGLSVCCGGILGMGETIEDRLDMLCTIANLDPAPESVPINLLKAVPGTPLGLMKKVPPFELVRIVALARIAVPLARIRMSCGRSGLSWEAQALCFLAGANSIFLGEKLLTVDNPGWDEDEKMLENLGIEKPSSRKR